MPIIGIGGTASVTQVFPKRACIFVDELTVLTGNAIAVDVQSLEHYNMIGRQSAAANGDEFTWTWLLASGSYTVYILGATGTASGIFDLYVKQLPSGSFSSFSTGNDMYSAVTVWNVIKTATITLAESALYEFKSKVNGKNASSSAYEIFLAKIWIKPNAD